ncbi:hypothetical protein [Burkholderia pseudomallei]
MRAVLTRIADHSEQPGSKTCCHGT